MKKTNETSEQDKELTDTLTSGLSVSCILNVISEYIWKDMPCSEEHRKSVLVIAEAIRAVVAPYDTLDSITERYNEPHNIIIRPWAPHRNVKRHTSLPECAQTVYFPWRDVLASMIENPGKVSITEEVCPVCGGKIISLVFLSPPWTWKSLCGRAGFMNLCPNCPRQISFSLAVMN